jgi:aryl-alcohol dehydrogenase-like predicted oxidoreductase
MSEKLVGQALKDLGVKRSDVVIATKVFGEMGKGPNDRGASRGHIMDAVQGSLERLQTDHIDLYQIHGNDTVTPLDETLRALDDLVTRRAWCATSAVSNWAAWKIAKALGISEAQGLRALRDAAGLLLHRRARPGARDGSDAHRARASA